MMVLIGIDNDERFWFAHDFQTFIDAHQGNGVVYGLATSASGSPDMQTHVAVGRYRANGVEVVKTSITDLTHDTADATNPRYDVIQADSAGTISIKKGTAASSPLVPDQDANKIRLALVYIPANDTAIESPQITDGIIRPVSFAHVNATAPTSPVAGQLWFDTKVVQTYDGSAWKPSSKWILLYEDNAPVTRSDGGVTNVTITLKTCSITNPTNYNSFKIVSGLTDSHSPGVGGDFYCYLEVEGTMVSKIGYGSALGTLTACIAAELGWYDATHLSFTAMNAYPTPAFSIGGFAVSGDLDINLKYYSNSGGGSNWGTSAAVQTFQVWGAV